MAFDIYTLYAVNIATTAAVDLFIDQIVRQRISPGIQRILAGGSGSVDPTYVAVMDQKPTITFDTTALATVLASCGISGLKIDSDVDDVGAEFWFQKLEEGGTRATGANHRKMTVNEGLLVPVEIRAPHNGAPATLSMSLAITWDGTNDPIVLESSQSLTGSPSVGEIFTAGPVMINGAEVEGIQETIIRFGLDVMTIGGSGSVWPTYAAIRAREPEIVFTTLDASHFATYGFSGTAQGATDSIVYLRKVAEGATRVANATAEHISFTLDEGMVHTQEVGGDHNNPQMPSLIFVPTYDGSNAIIVVNTATAIA